MIRLIQRKLIIPQGDTGSFSIPVLSQAASVAVFSLMNPLTKEIVLEKEAPVDGDTLVFEFMHEDTANLPVRKYLYDITLYTSPIYDEDNKLVGGEAVDSYYAAYSLPVCEIREGMRK